jgi:hypothetical protein
MSRAKGIASFSANFEVHTAAPLDSRCLVGTKADLTSSVIWQGNDNGNYTYLGMVVSIAADPTPTNNGVYQLIASDYTNASNWVKLGSGGGSTYTHTQAVSAATWSVTHNLGRYPNVAVRDTAISNELVYGTVTYLDTNSLTISFSAGFTGEAYLT